MNSLVRSQNFCFPLSSLPDDVVYCLAQYLSPREMEIMAQLNRHFREIFNSPHLWKDVKLKIRLRGKQIASDAIEILKVRGIRSLEISFLNAPFLNPPEIIQPFLCPRLEELSFPLTSQRSLEALYKAASEGKLKPRKLAFGRVDVYGKLKPTFEEVFKSLPSVEEVSFDSVDLNDITCTNPLAFDVQKALCSNGKLTSISLQCQGAIELSWLKALISSNPHLQRLCLRFQRLADEGELHKVKQGAFSSLETLGLHVGGECYRNKGITCRRLPVPTPVTNLILDWAFPNNKVPNRNLTCLDVTSRPRIPIMFTQLHKFPALKKLNLTGAVMPNEHSLQDFPNFQSLEWLELNSCQLGIRAELHFLSEKVGRTLCYLGLGKIPSITNNDLRDLAVMFPVLRTLDLTECSKITDALLVEWYIKQKRSEWPKLRKLILKGCEEITVDVVNSVRLKTRNQLLVDL